MRRSIRGSRRELINPARWWASVSRRIRMRRKIKVSIARTFSQNSYIPRAQSTMYQPWENSQFPYTQPNLPGSAEHYTHQYYPEQQTRPPIGTHILHKQLPPFTKVSDVTSPRTSQSQTARVHFEEHPAVDSRPLIDLNRTSRIETSQSLQFSRNNPGLLREANLQLPGSISQSVGEVNTQPAVSQVSSSQIRYSQSSINQ